MFLGYYYVNKRTFQYSLELEKVGTQIFYSHIKDKEENHIYQPSEKVITVIKKD